LRFELWPALRHILADFEKAYLRFGQRLRSEEPKAFFILAANDVMDAKFIDADRSFAWPLAVGNQ